MRKGIQKSSFGRLQDGSEIDLYTLTNENGLRCQIATYGGIITRLETPDRAGRLANIVLGYDRLEEYETGKAYLGAIIGRVASRIGGARFTLDGKTFALAANDGRNHLHGGVRGFDRRVWQAAPDGNSLRLQYTSADGEEGYPGTLHVAVTYALNDANELSLDYEAVTDQPTPVNLTSHPYWNLAGEKEAGDILGHELTVAADSYTPGDAEYILTGEIKPVEGTPLDFRSPAVTGSRSSQHNTNYVLRQTAGRSVFAAKVREPQSGRALEIWTDQPCLQFYSGFFLSGKHAPSSGLCLETQNFPDAVNHGNFPSTILRPGETYRHRTVCRFSTG